MPTPRDVLTPGTLSMLQTIAEAGSFAAAARSLGMVPSALTYRVRQLEDALDVLLFDRSTRQARLTEAGRELLASASTLLSEVDAIAHRVKRIATGWEAQFTIAVDSIIDPICIMELCSDFLALNPPTRLKLRTETLSGTLEALSCGQADLALGVVMDDNTRTGLQRAPLGKLSFVFAMAPHHPLASVAEPIPDDIIRQYRGVAIADSNPHGTPLTIGLLAGQDVFTVASMAAKVDAQIRGLGIGNLPGCIAQPYLDTGRLVARQIERQPGPQYVECSYAWRAGSSGARALRWWLDRLNAPQTRAALLGSRPGRA
jgi:DNA-binding transcriptional LysR family regulator